MKIIHTPYNLNENVDEVTEKIDHTILLETTGYEPMKKRIDRLMVAGMNLYDANRFGKDYQGSTAEELETQPAYMTRWKDAKDVNMRMREIMKRLKRKVNRGEVPSPENIEHTETAAEAPAEPKE